MFAKSITKKGLLPVYAYSSLVVIERAVSVLASQLSECCFSAHFLYWQTLEVSHEKSPHFKLSFHYVSPHFDTSTENSVPEGGVLFFVRVNVMKLLSRPGHSHTITFIVGILQSVIFVKVFILTQMLPKMDASSELTVYHF